jgi:hypothetical protein
MEADEWTVEHDRRPSWVRLGASTPGEVDDQIAIGLADTAEQHVVAVTAACDRFESHVRERMIARKLATKLGE